MGFFKNIFKRKSGGTMFGNLLRGVASSASGGILGNGSGLAKWQAKEDGVAFDKAVKLAAAAKVEQSDAFRLGSPVGETLKPLVDKAIKSPEAEALKKSVMIDWLKKNWWIPAVILVLPLAVWGIVKLVKK